MKKILSLLLLLSTYFCLANPLHAQGLLGQKYFSAGYELVSPNNNDLRAVSQWAHGLNLQMRRPVTERFDWLADVKFNWFGGSTVMSGIPVEIDSDFTSLSTSVSYNHTPVELPIGILTFFNGVGVSYANLNAEVKSGFVAVSNSDDDFEFTTLNGFELRFSEQTSLLASISTGQFLFDDEIEDDIFDGLEFQADLIHWWGPHLFSGFLIGSDFDNTEITLGGYLGVGNW